MKIAFFGSSLCPPTGTAPPPTTAGILRALAARGHRHHLLRARRLRPAAAPRHRPAGLGRRAWSIRRPRTALRGVVAEAARADVVVKASGVGVFDDALLEGAVPRCAARTRSASSGTSTRRRRSTAMRAATRPIRCAALMPALRPGAAPMAAADPVVAAYEGFGARRCVPIYNALDPDDASSRCRPTPRFAADLAFLGNRLPDREARVEEFFLRAGGATAGPPLPARRQRLGRQGACRRTCATSATSTRATTTPSTASPLAVLNVARDSMARRRLLAGDPRVRGGRRRRLPDHRRLGGHRAVPRARTRRCSSPATARRSPSTCAALTPERARAIGEAARRARARRAHLRAPRRARSTRMLREAAARKRAEERRMTTLASSSSA